MQLRPLFFLSGFLHVLASRCDRQCHSHGHGHGSRHGQTTITSDPSVVSNQRFDYIVAGGGLTGLVVANKLSGKGFKVLVVEAGPDAKDEIDILNAALGGDLAPGICNWKYTASFDDGSPIPILVDSGRCLGGSTSINGKAWLHPAKAEMDALEALGSPGWNFDNLFPKMIETETFIPPTDTQISQGATFNNRLHGTSGPVNVSFPTPMRIPAAQALFKAAMPIAFPGLVLSDDISHRTVGGSVLASNVWTIWFDAVAGFNKRSSAAFAYLYAPNQQRSTLTVLTGHQVAKVLFDSRIKATGIQFLNSATGGTTFTAFASKEVILATGTLQTPALLERSGIGGSAILSQFGINQLVDLPGVGLNLHDQPGTFISASVNPANATNTELIDGVGIFAPVISLVTLRQLFGDASDAAKQNIVNGIPQRAAAAVAAGTAANLEGATKLFNKAAHLIIHDKMPVGEVIGESFTFANIMASVFWPSLPFSRGHIHISSIDPLANPVITPRFLTDQFDLDVGVALAKRSRVMFQSVPFNSVVADAAVDAVPEDGTTTDWEEFLRSTSFGASHWVGTSALLPRRLGGVVSPDLKVYGTKGLRVVDASILPLEISSHPMPALYAIALRAADLILRDS